MELGWSLVKRREHIKELLQAGAIAEHRLEFQDRLQNLPVVTVPIGLPKYRLLNGRTASLQQEWLSENPDKSEDFFQRDPELTEAQEIQHQLLTKLIHGAGLLAYFRDTKNKQKEYIILDAHGYVINGNRRLCAWRTLLSQDGDAYGHFGHVDAVILPPCDDKAIDKLEGALQIEPDIRDDYTWDSLANMMQDRKKLHRLSNLLSVNSLF